MSDTLQAVVDALPEFRRQDDYLLAYGAMTEMTDKYRWDKDDGVCIGHKQQIQLCGGTREFRKRCGRLLVDVLNMKERVPEIIAKLESDDYEHVRAMTVRGGKSRVNGEFTADELEAIAFWMRRNA